MTQMALFDNLSASAFPAGNVRQKQIDAALAKAHDAWRVRFEEFILEYAARATEPFTGEDVWDAYDATPGQPRTDRRQAAGGIFQRLVRTGQLQRAEMKRSRKFGNFLQAYSAELRRKW